MSEDETSTSYSAAITAMRAKRRALSKELTTFLQSTKSDGLPTLNDFYEKNKYFEGLWEDVVKQSANCQSLIDSN